MNSYDLAENFGMLSKEEIDLLKGCVRQLPEQAIIINIGANVGTSSIAMLEERPNAFIFSIDIRVHPEERNHVIECGLNPKRIVRLLGNSAEIGIHFPYQADLVFVDGSHTDNGVRGDIDAWIPKCKRFALFHDYHHPNYAKKPGVNLDQIVDQAMVDWERVGEARYLVAFKKHPVERIAMGMSIDEAEDTMRDLSKGYIVD